MMTCVVETGAEPLDTVMMLGVDLAARLCSPPYTQMPAPHTQGRACQRPPSPFKKHY